MMRPTFTRGCLVVAFSLLLCGCRIDADVLVDVDRSGGGALTLTLAADADAVARAQAAGAEPLALVAEAADALAPGGWSASTSVTPDGGREVAVSVEFADPEQLHQLSSDLAEALAAPELRPLEPLTLTLTEDRVRLEGAAALQPREEVTELGFTQAQAEALLAEHVSYALRVDLPGATVDTTAPRATQDGVLVWNVAAGEREVVRAVGVRPPPSWRLPAAVAAALLFAAVTAAALLRRRRRAG